MTRSRPFPPRAISRGLALFVVAIAALLGGCAHRVRGIASHDVMLDNAHFRVVTINLATDRLDLHWRNPSSGKPFSDIPTLEAWGKAHGQQLVFAANAGIYDAHRQPLGLYVENGKALKPLNVTHGNPAAGNFSVLPNGVFAVDGSNRAAVYTTAAFAAAHIHPRIATQSGPMLVIDDRINPAFSAASDSVKWRSGVCAPKPSRVVFAVSTSPVTFYAFARLFRDKLHCRNALYLDGTLSQIYVNGSYYGAPAFMVKPYAGIFSVFVPAKQRP